MKNASLILHWIILLTIFSFLSCKKESDIDDTNENPNSETSSIFGNYDINIKYEDNTTVSKRGNVYLDVNNKLIIEIFEYYHYVCEKTGDAFVVEQKVYEPEGIHDVTGNGTIVNNSISFNVGNISFAGTRIGPKVQKPIRFVVGFPHDYISNDLQYSYMFSLNKAGVEITKESSNYCCGNIVSDFWWSNLDPGTYVLSCERFVYHNIYDPTGESVYSVKSLCEETIILDSTSLLNPTLAWAELPALLTNNVTNINGSTATCGGEVVYTGGQSITERGVCWKANGVPSYTDNKTSDGLSGSTFVSYLTNLQANTMYYVRAYAVSTNGIGYGTARTFTTGEGILTDADGNTYSTVTIGNQIWMAENLKTTHYNDGTPIPHLETDADWYAATNDGYCWFDNNESANKDEYGALYKWKVIPTGKICPIGWHVPSDTEWEELINNFGGMDYAGGSLKETGYTHWNSPNTGATNESGFSGRGAGIRYTTGTFNSFKMNAYFWSSDDSDNGFGTMLGSYYSLHYVYEDVSHSSTIEDYGHSIRCIKD